MRLVPGWWCWLSTASSAAQQTLTVLVLALCNTADIYVGVGHVLATHSISSALTLHLEQLSADQRAVSLQLASRMRGQAITVTVMVLCTLLCSVLLIAVPMTPVWIAVLRLHQALITFAQAAGQFHLIKAPKHRRPCAASVVPELPVQAVSSGGRKQ